MDEVKITKEQKANPEQVAKAREMMLPDSFYMYEQKTPCKGCIGCDEHDEHGEFVHFASSAIVLS